MLLLLLCAIPLFAQDYKIVGPENPKPYEATAMQELTDYLGKRVKGKLEIGGKSLVTFHVGETALAKENKLLSTDLEDEQWFVKSLGDNVVINGGGTRGALYATYHFLEDCCDIHWWSDFEEYVPEAGPLKLKALDMKGKPAFISRDIYRSQNEKGPNSDLTAIRVRLNRNGGNAFSLLPIEYGGAFTCGSPWHVHTFNEYVSFRRYGKEHPEYFSLVNGKRVGGQMQGQLCLSNPDLRQLFLTKLLQYIENDRRTASANGLPPPRIYEVSQNDNHNRCTCENCRAEEEKYNPSGFYLNFVNWLASEVKKTHPNIFLRTLAYHYTAEPPKGGVRAADNVIVRLCDTRTNQAASILSAENQKYLRLLQSWKNYATHLHIWDYAIAFTDGVTGFPFASELDYGDLHRIYHENNVTGIFWEHERPHCADFYELKFFLESKLLENPYQDLDKLISLFMDRYYGDAATLLMQYRKEVAKAQKRHSGYIGTYPPPVAFSFIENKDIIRFQKMFDDAEKKVATDDIRLSRVRHARVGLDKLTCTRVQPFIYHDKETVIDSLPQSFCKEAYDRVARHEENWLRHWTNNDEMLTKHREELATMRKAVDSAPILHAFPPPEELNGRVFHDFYAPHFKNLGKGHVELVDDTESTAGKAMRSDVDSNQAGHYDLPFEFGIFDTIERVTTSSPQFARPLGVGYHWYKMGKPVRMPFHSFIWMTRAWTTQLPTAQSNIYGREFEIWVSVKFTGPKFFEGSKDGNYIYIDRVLMVSPQTF